MNIRRALIGLLAVPVILALHGCVNEPPPPAAVLPNLPTSHWGDHYSYTYDLPTQTTAPSVNITIIDVNPLAKEEDSAFTNPTFAPVGKGFAKSMGVDLDKIIVAKGMTALGPYDTLDDVTYPDKKAADLTLAPRVFLIVNTTYSEWTQVSYQQGFYVQRTFQMKISGWVSFEMREPLSSEKMWVKKLDLDDKTVTGLEICEATPKYQQVWQDAGLFTPGGYVQQVTGYDSGKMVYDGKADAVADMLKDIYPTIMGKAWTYLNTDEMLDLKAKTKEIRDRKVY
jgi:hypothetical protein